MVAANSRDFYCAAYSYAASIYRICGKSLDGDTSVTAFFADKTRAPLGITFLPFTTVMYMLVWKPTGIAG